jgi:hypothetical protein
MEISLQIISGTGGAREKSPTDLSYEIRKNL